jgi:DNA polymerase I
MKTESQMELRVQAQYTIFHSKEPDKNLCRAYMPYKCYYEIQSTGKRCSFDYNDKEHLKNFPKVKWFKEENDEEWTPTDLHSETTQHAFPHFINLDPDKDKKEYKHLRGLGKRCNFLKVYQGGVLALMDSLEIDRKTAEALDQAFYKAFPRIRDYQEWVAKQAGMYGYVENLYGRRYYMNDSKWFYKLCNYLIQGTCADMVKQFQIDIAKFLKEGNYKTKMVLPVHDEIIFLVPEGEEHIMKDIKAIMENVTDVITNVPMIAEIEYTETNWNEKKGWKE